MQPRSLSWVFLKLKSRANLEQISSKSRVIFQLLEIGFCNQAHLWLTGGNDDASENWRTCGQDEFVRPQDLSIVTAEVDVEEILMIPKVSEGSRQVQGEVIPLQMERLTRGTHASKNVCHNFFLLLIWKKK